MEWCRSIVLWTSVRTYYLCTEQIFASPQFVYKKIFLNKLLWNLVAYIFPLLLAPFASKFVNYSRRSESLNIRKKSKSVTFSSKNNDLSMFKYSLRAHCVQKYFVLPELWAGQDSFSTVHTGWLLYGGPVQWKLRPNRLFVEDSGLFNFRVLLDMPCLIWNL